MPFRFRRSFKILPGIKLNISKGGLSTSFGVKGLHLNIGKRGVRQTVGLPGTGLSFTQTVAKAPHLQLGVDSLGITQPTPAAGRVAAIAGIIPRSMPAKLGLLALAAVLLCYAGFFCLALIAILLPPPPPPTVNASGMTMSVATRLFTAATKPTLTRAPTATYAPTGTVAAIPTAFRIATVPPYVGPINTVPPRPTAGRYCCKHCSNSQPCGDSCISNAYTCHKPPGCACP